MVAKCIVDMHITTVLNDYWHTSYFCGNMMGEVSSPICRVKPVLDWQQILHGQVSGDERVATQVKHPFKDK